jgi:hypothetical protein
MPYPDNLDNHFAVDPATVNRPDSTENRLAKAYAEDVIRLGTDYDGIEQAPMRIREAHVTISAVSARYGNLEDSISHGRNPLHTLTNS